MRRFSIFTAIGFVVLGGVALTQTDALPPATLNQEGLEAYNAGDYERAIEVFEDVYGRVPENEIVRRNLVNAYQSRADQLAKMGRLDQAMDFVDAAIATEPGNPSPLVQSGAYYLRQNDLDKAITKLETAIKVAPGTLEAHQLLGEAYYRDNDIPSARVQWDYVLEIDHGKTDLRERYEKAFREEAVEGDFNRAGSRHFTISYPAGISYRYRSWILTTLERAYMDIGRTLGGEYPPGPIQVIVYDAQQFNEATQLGGHIGGLFDGKIRIPLTDEKGEFLSDDELKRRLYHEYAHVVIRNIVNTHEVPWWLNEGLAEALSRDIDGQFEQTVAGLYGSGDAIPLDKLESSQLYALDANKLRLAYRQAHAVIDMLWTRHGKFKMVRLLKDINGGTKPEDAMRNIYGVRYGDVDALMRDMYAQL